MDIQKIKYLKYKSKYLNLKKHYKNNINKYNLKQQIGGEDSLLLQIDFKSQLTPTTQYLEPQDKIVYSSFINEDHTLIITIRGSYIYKHTGHLNVNRDATREIRRTQHKYRFKLNNISQIAAVACNNNNIIIYDKINEKCYTYTYTLTNQNLNYVMVYQMRFQNDQMKFENVIKPLSPSLHTKYIMEILNNNIIINITNAEIRIIELIESNQHKITSSEPFNNTPNQLLITSPTTFSILYSHLNRYVLINYSVSHLNINIVSQIYLDYIDIIKIFNYDKDMILICSVGGWILLNTGFLTIYNFRIDHYLYPRLLDINDSLNINILLSDDKTKLTISLFTTNNCYLIFEKTIPSFTNIIKPTLFNVNFNFGLRNQIDHVIVNDVLFIKCHSLETSRRKSMLIYKIEEQPTMVDYLIDNFQKIRLTANEGGTPIYYNRHGNTFINTFIITFKNDENVDDAYIVNLFHMMITIFNIDYSPNTSIITEHEGLDPIISCCKLSTRPSLYLFSASKMYILNILNKSTILSQDALRTRKEVLLPFVRDIQALSHSITYTHFNILPNGLFVALSTERYTDRHNRTIASNNINLFELIKNTDTDVYRLQVTKSVKIIEYAPDMYYTPHIHLSISPNGCVLVSCDKQLYYYCNNLKILYKYSFMGSLIEGNSFINDDSILLCQSSRLLQYNINDFIKDYNVSSINLINNQRNRVSALIGYERTMIPIHYITFSTNRIEYENRIIQQKNKEIQEDNENIERHNKLIMAEARSLRSDPQASSAKMKERRQIIPLIPPFPYLAKDQYYSWTEPLYKSGEHTFSKNEIHNIFNSLYDNYVHMINNDTILVYDEDAGAVITYKKPLRIEQFVKLFNTTGADIPSSNTSRAQGADAGGIVISIFEELSKFLNLNKDTYNFYGYDMITFDENHYALLYAGTNYHFDDSKIIDEYQFLGYLFAVAINNKLNITLKLHPLLLYQMLYDDFYELNFNEIINIINIFDKNLLQYFPYNCYSKKEWTEKRICQYVNGADEHKGDDEEDEPQQGTLENRFVDTTKNVHNIFLESKAITKLFVDGFRSTIESYIKIPNIQVLHFLLYGEENIKLSTVLFNFKYKLTHGDVFVQNSKYERFLIKLFTYNEMKEPSYIKYLLNEITGGSSFPAGGYPGGIIFSIVELAGNNMVYSHTCFKTIDINRVIFDELLNRFRKDVLVNEDPGHIDNINFDSINFDNLQDEALISVLSPEYLKQNSKSYTRA